MPALSLRPRMPRPDDPDILQRIVAATLKGHPIQTAGRIAGLGHTTAWDWLRQGEALLTANPDKEPGELGSHAVFADAVKRAEAEFVDANLDYVLGARAPDAKGWLPAMTLLERRRPQDFGRTARDTGPQVNVTVNVQAQLDGGTLRFIAERALAQAQLQQGTGAIDAEVHELPPEP